MCRKIGSGMGRKRFNLSRSLCEIINTSEHLLLPFFPYFCSAMSILIKKSFVWIWMAALLTATAGISVHQMYCYCKDLRTVSLFTTPEECSAQEAELTSDCCSKQESMLSSCCAKSPSSSPQKHGCTEKTTKVYQLNVQFTLGESGSDQSSQFPADLAPIPDGFCSTLRSEPALQTGIQSFANPPPPLSGRMICVRHCLALC